MNLKVILRGEATEPDASGNLFLTNVHQLYESRDQAWTPQNAVDALLGKKPAKDLAAGQRSMLERIKSLKDLVVMNDEAHHVHDEDLAWSQSLLAIHRAQPKGLGLWLDFSATPKDQGGMYFPWTVCDYPYVRDYVVTRCFGKKVNTESDVIRSHLSRLEIQEGIAKYLARKIAELTIDRLAIEFEKANFKLSDTKPFSWRRNLPPLMAKKTVFNYVASYNEFERRFAEFLDKAADVLRFASLGTTEQGESGTLFRVDYLKPSGAIGFYHPDWVVVQKQGKKTVNWIIETKGRVWEGTDAKDSAITDWCARISKETSNDWQFKRVNQKDFDGAGAVTLDNVVLKAAVGII